MHFFSKVFFRRPVPLLPSLPPQFSKILNKMMSETAKIKKKPLFLKSKSKSPSIKDKAVNQNSTIHVLHTLSCMPFYLILRKGYNKKS